MHVRDQADTSEFWHISVLQACKLRKYVMLPITCSDRKVETVEADSATTAAEMCSALANKLALKDHFGFSIYICIYDKVCHNLSMLLKVTR